MLKSQDQNFLSCWIYDSVLWFLSLLIELFFREVKTRGSYRVPRLGPAIFVAAPHANQFVDPLILASQVRIEAKRRIAFLVAEKSMKMKIIGTLARALGSISCRRVEDIAKYGPGVLYRNEDDDELIVRGRRTQFSSLKTENVLILPDNGGSAQIEAIVSDDILTLKTNFRNKDIANMLLRRNSGCKYKFSPKVDQNAVYKEVFRRLESNGCIGIFPEGGSHDRTELLPLKAGAAIIALGVLSRHPDTQLKIVPCGLNYFHPNKFRSRAIIDFGPPFEVPRELVELYSQGEHRAAVSRLLDIISDALESVTSLVPDMETLQIVQAGRRLYKPSTGHVPLSKVVELQRRFMKGYLKFKDNPQVIELREEILDYNKELSLMGIRDHQLKYVKFGFKKVSYELTWRILKLVVLGLLALPGSILFTPVFVATTKISRRKAREALLASSVKIEARDVIATWKLLVALVIVPILYVLYSILATIAVGRYYDIKNTKSALCHFAFFMILMPTITLAALTFGESGLDTYKSIKPLILSLIPSSANSLERLRRTRAHMSSVLNELMDSKAAEKFQDMNEESRMKDSESPTNSSSSISSKVSRINSYSSFDFDAINPSPTISREDSFIDSSQNILSQGNIANFDQVSAKIRENLRQINQRRLINKAQQEDSVLFEKNISSSDEEDYYHYD